jgi:hypothetical protein
VIATHILHPTGYRAESGRLTNDDSFETLQRKKSEFGYILWETECIDVAAWLPLMVKRGEAMDSHWPLQANIQHPHFRNFQPHQHEYCHPHVKASSSTPIKSSNSVFGIQMIIDRLGKDKM